MQIVFETAYLAPGQIQSADAVSVNGEQIVDEADFFRAAAANFFPRGNLKVEFRFITHWSFTTTVAAEVFVLTYANLLPMTNTDIGTVQCVCGAENPGTEQTCYMINAVLKGVSIKYVGTSVDVEYTILGPGFTTNVPPNLPIAPTPNVPQQVCVRGKQLLTNGQVSPVAVSFGVTLPGPPGADPDCWISGPTGSETFGCRTDSDSVTTSGFNVDLDIAVPGNGYYLNWVVFS